MAAVLVFVFLCSEQWDIVRRVGLGQMPRQEVRNGYELLAGYAVGMVLLVFRPMLRIDPAGTVHVRNPVGSRRFCTEEVRDVSVDRWGLTISLSSGRTVRSIIFQDTKHFGEPRWFEVAEALTGVRPELPPWANEAGWDDDPDA